MSVSVEDLPPELLKEVHNCFPCPQNTFEFTSQLLCHALSADFPHFDSGVQEPELSRPEQSCNNLQDVEEGGF